MYIPPPTFQQSNNISLPYFKSMNIVNAHTHTHNQTQTNSHRLTHTLIHSYTHTHIHTHTHTHTHVLCLRNTDIHAQAHWEARGLQARRKCLIKMQLLCFWMGTEVRLGGENEQAKFPIIRLSTKPRSLLHFL